MDVLIVAIVFGSLFASFAVAILSGTALTFSAMHLIAGALRDSNRLRRADIAARVEAQRLRAGLPLVVDRSDPRDVAAWNDAVSEVYA